MKHTISVLVNNRPGVLARTAGLFSRRGFNIDSLAVATTQDPETSRMTIVVDGPDAILEQISKQLYKLLDVIKVLDHQNEPIIVARAGLDQGGGRAGQPGRDHADREHLPRQHRGRLGSHLHHRGDGRGGQD